MSYTNVSKILCILAVFGAALVSVAPVLSQTPYYAGNTIAIIRGGGPGGSGEFQSRAVKGEPIRDCPAFLISTHSPRTIQSAM